ncbi:MAG: GNAT family N-acetyltransferase [Bacteroidota bacterium]
MYTYQLIPKTEMHSIIPILRLLNDQVSEEILKERLAEMLDKGYECLGVFDDKKLIGICGLWILVKCYVGRHIEPDNVMILPEYRNKGIGEEMMAWIYAYGRSQGCIASELNCYTTNSGGQKFWANEGYKILGFHYQRPL